MKKFFLLTIIITMFSISATIAQNLNLKGTWEIDQKETSITGITFGANDSLIMIMNRETWGGKDFKINGKVATLTYKVDLSVKPAPIDFILSEGEDQKQTIAKGLIMVIKPNVIKIALNMNGGERPKDFTVSNSGFFKKIEY